MELSKYYNYNLAIGLNDKDTKTQVIPTKKARSIVVKYAKKFLKDATIDRNSKIGVYTYQDGTTVEEVCLNVNYKTQSLDRMCILEFIENIKKKLNQECVMLTCTTEDVDFL